MKSALTALGAIAVSALSASGDIYRVDGSVPVSGNGSTWGQAYKYLSDALAIAGEEDEVWIAAGTYYPDESVQNPSGSGDRETAFLIDEDFKVYGGFDRDRTIRT